MKTFKTIDYMGQVALLIVSVFVVVIFGLKIDGPGIYTYFFVGGWQFISMIIHLFIDSSYKIKLRTLYIGLLGLTMFIGFASLATEYIIHFFIGLLFWSPVLAIMYVVCCYKELQKMSAADNITEQAV